MKQTLILTLIFILASCSSIEQEHKDRVAQLGNSQEAQELESLLISEKKIEELKDTSVSSLEKSDLESIIEENKAVAQAAAKPMETVAKAPAVEPDNTPKGPITVSSNRSPASIKPQRNNGPSFLTIPRYLHVDLAPTDKGFLKSAKKATAETLKYMLSKGVDINVQDQSGRTALIMAVEARRYDIVRFLLRNGADKSLSDQSGLGPYEYATKNEDDKMKKILLATE
ncbi:ankyrin repeat protein [Bacteriovorax sp. BSW11_IV]|uniref:ankyrin repeat domain-containing protein n=1 Tax=Bacteriovorax sp. BSW11_IV TaxID=1353529 RepID=UPI00038A4FA4|nr:ankyrin repeat domain-containing protein [Bacteriovorax sp. BSW11_IV]EQC50127.1 ankyrin repeat protein [Bacteriovorax sp. BSW11_IV]